MLPVAASGSLAPVGTRKNVGPLPASSVPLDGSIAIEPMSAPEVVAEAVVPVSSVEPPHAAASSGTRRRRRERDRSIMRSK